jgi:hypothetical protein
MIYTGYWGTPVYACHQTMIVTTTFLTSSSRGDLPIEVAATSSPVVMYEIATDLVVYATSYEPRGVYSKKINDRYFWPPGLAKSSPEAKGWVSRAAEMSKPSSNATVITYTIGEKLVYLTNERPVFGIHAERSDALFVWIPGVREPSSEEKDAIATAVSAHSEGGGKALDLEVRKLEEDRSPPQSIAAGGSATP